MRTKLLTGAILLIVAAPALADEWDFVLNNKTGKTIKMVELAPSGSQTWASEQTEQDRESTIKPGASFTVHFTKDASACKFDVRLTYDDDSTAVFPALNVCDNAFADFSYNGATPVVKGS
ncbi:MAG: hypothetical protein ACTHK5_13955 [Tsuneonella sp.]